MVWTDIFIKRPVLSVVVSLLILLIGLRAATVLPIRQYPKLSNTVVNVTTSYPGASADLIQGFITTPIEQAVASADSGKSAALLRHDSEKACPRTTARWAGSFPKTIMLKQTLKFMIRFKQIGSRTIGAHRDGLD